MSKLVLYVEKSIWESLAGEPGGTFCVHAYTAVEDERHYIKFSPVGEIDLASSGLTGRVEHNSANAIQCLIEDFDSYIDGSVDPDMESHECSRDNAIQVQETLAAVRKLGAAIEEGCPQRIADIWLKIKPEVAIAEVRGCATAETKERN